MMMRVFIIISTAGRALVFFLLARTLNASNHDRPPNNPPHTHTPHAHPKTTPPKNKAIARPMYSNPPLHGALLVSTVLHDPLLKAQWYEVRRARGCG